MKKQVLIIHSTMELGGAETSLLGMLQSFDYETFDVDLMLLNPVGELMQHIPNDVNIIKTHNCYNDLMLPIKNVVKKFHFGIAIARIFAKIKCNLFMKNYNDKCYIVKQYQHYYSLPFLSKIKKEYDLAISFIDPHFILNKKVKSKVKIGWFHTDSSRIDFNNRIEKKMWNNIDYAVNVSENCKAEFDKKHQYLTNHSIVIENILSKTFLHSQSAKFIVNNEYDRSTNSQILLTIGRFSYAKRLDEVPQICKILKDNGVNFKWYVIGYGSEEDLIKSKIADAGVENEMIILGKRNNPYPYIKKCDVYVQPSRYEGKSVTVREAQILGKPVIITNYPTAPSQLTGGYDGIIVPLDVDGCAKGICDALDNKELLQTVAENTKKVDYTNKSELEKLYALID